MCLLDQLQLYAHRLHFPAEHSHSSVQSDIFTSQKQQTWKVEMFLQWELTDKTTESDVEEEVS